MVDAYTSSDAVVSNYQCPTTLSTSTKVWNILALQRYWLSIDKSSNVSSYCTCYTSGHVLCTSRVEANSHFSQSIPSRSASVSLDQDSIVSICLQYPGNCGIFAQRDAPCRKSCVVRARRLYQHYVSSISCLTSRFLGLSQSSQPVSSPRLKIWYRDDVSLARHHQL